jgi:hypothetical protein
LCWLAAAAAAGCQAGLAVPAEQTLANLLPLLLQMLHLV